MDCTIITYHYVRDLENSRYPDLKALDYNLFKRQIEFIAKKYSVITMERLIDACYIGTELPKNAALLAFDDGYVDHYTHVFPILNKYSFQGSFFVPVQPIMENKMMDVNKIHYLLESIRTDCIIKDIEGFLDAYREEYNLPSFEYFYKQFSEHNRFDDLDTMFVKRFLQRWDNVKLKSQLINQLFGEFVEFLNEDSEREEVLAHELYMNIDQIKDMHEAGMYIGAHTNTHPHLGSLPVDDQIAEIQESKKFIESIGTPAEYLTLSYPYGSHNDPTKQLLKTMFGFKFGIGIDHGTFDTETGDRFNVPRIDCNDVTELMKK